MVYYTLSLPWLSAAKEIPMDTDRAGASYREQEAWAMLIITVLVYGGFVGFMLGNGLFGTRAASAVLCVAIAIQAILGGVVAAIMASRTKPEPKDERDVLINRRSVQCGYVVMAVLVMTAAIMLIWWPLPRDMTPPTPIFIGHVLLCCFVIAEIVRMSVQVMLYRRTA